MPIRQLPPLLVNQIAAGEVIERPASVVKEAVENALDAGATRIEVAIEEGGKALIRITDNGGGIPFDELPLALAAHATSKIEAAEDLDAIATMGFRGEALASIASVSRLTLVSRPADQEGAGRIDAEGDVLNGPRPEGAPPGTTLTVRTLFFNTPARRKFMRADQTETSRVRDVVETIALAHPEIAFTFTADGRTRLDLPPGQDARGRALAVLGPELADELLEFDAAGPPVRLWGLAGRPGIARGTARHQHVYLNGRAINDRTLNHAIREAYRGLIEPGRFPTIVLFLVIDPAAVDVNVHPAKAEVRFRDPSGLHGAVRRSIQARLAEADLTPAIDLGRRDEAAVALPSGPAPVFGAGRVAHTGHPAPPRTVIEDFRRLDARQKGFVYAEVKQALAEEAPEVLGVERLDAPIAPPPAEARVVTEALQVHRKYIVAPDDEGLVIIDQHALHERVMFEKLKSRVEAGPLESQRLLMPATAQVGRAQIELLDTLRPLLERLGIEAEPMGPETVALHAFTSLLFERGVDPVEFITGLLDDAATKGANHDPEAALHEVLDMMACKAAIKAGDALTPAEIGELLAFRDTTGRASRCPHGRPTTLRLTLADLDRQFGRT